MRSAYFRYSATLATVHDAVYFSTEQEPIISFYVLTASCIQFRFSPNTYLSPWQIRDICPMLFRASPENSSKYIKNAIVVAGTNNKNNNKQITNDKTRRGLKKAMTKHYYMHSPEYVVISRY